MVEIHWWETIYKPKWKGEIWLGLLAVKPLNCSFYLVTLKSDSFFFQITLYHSMHCKANISINFSYFFEPETLADFLLTKSIIYNLINGVCVHA